MKTAIKTVISAVVLIHLSASAALAQATIAGIVRDSSGAVLPGVTVEATSPSLTEKVRTALTDGTGQYRIVTLPPGNYELTFSLTGFTTVKRDNIEAGGGQWSAAEEDTFRAPIRAQMAECLDTVNVRQLHVHQNDVGLVLDRELDSP